MSKKPTLIAKEFMDSALSGHGSEVRLVQLRNIIFRGLNTMETRPGWVEAFYDEAKPMEESPKQSVSVSDLMKAAQQFLEHDDRGETLGLYKVQVGEDLLTRGDLADLISSKRNA